MDNGLQASQSERVAHSAKLAQTSVPAPSTAANDIKKDLLDLDCSSPTPTSSYPGMGRYPPPEADSLLLNSGCCSYLSTWTGDSLQQQHQQHQHQQTMLSSAFQDYGLQQSPHHQHHHLQQQQHQQQLQHQQQQQYNLQPAMYDLSVSSRHHHLAQHQHLQPHLAPPPLPPMMPHHQQSAQHPSEQQQQQQQQQQLKPPFGYLPLCHQPLGDGLSSVSTPVYHSAATGGIVTKGAPPPVQLPPPPLPPPPQPSLPAPPASAVTAARGANHSVSSSKSSSCSPPAVGSGRGHRPDKRPVPDTQKDTKYFERRKRNNEAAKKSRDARKHREDEVAVRASFLEKENAVLKAQMASLREEANSLRELLRKHSGLR